MKPVREMAKIESSEEKLRRKHSFEKSSRWTEQLLQEKAI
jgi:hypothetical protein